LSEPQPPNFLQRMLVKLCEVISFLEDQLGGDSQFRQAFLSELGLPLNTLENAQLPEGPCKEKILPYLQAKDPDLQAFLSVAEDIERYLDNWIGVIRAALQSADMNDSRAVIDEIVYRLFELATLNHLKYRYFGWYWWLRFFGFIYYETRVQLLERIDLSNFGQSAGELYRSLRFADLPTAPQIGAACEPVPPELPPEIASQLTPQIFAESDAIFGLLLGLDWLMKKLGSLPDLPLLDQYAGWDPSPDSNTPIADRISNRAVTFALGGKEDFSSQDGSVTGRGILTVLLVPGDEPGPGVLLSLRGDFAAKRSVKDAKGSWVASAKFSSAEAADFFISRHDFIASGDPAVNLSVKVQRKPAAPGPAAVLPANAGTRLEFGSLAFGLDLVSDGFKLTASAGDSVLVVSSRDGDFFTSRLMASREFRLNFDLGLVLSARSGQSLQLDLQGGAKLSATLAIGRTFGPLQVQSLQIGLTPTQKDGFVQFDFLFAASLSLELFGLTMVLEGIGFQTGWVISKGESSLPDDANRLAPFFGFTGLGFKSPNGIGVRVDTLGLTGGGFLFREPATGEYAGVLDLHASDLSLQLVGLISRAPDGDLSLLLFGALLGLEWSLGPMTRLTALSLRLGGNRTVNIEALRSGLKNGTLDLILFPKDPVGQAPRLIQALGKIFPPANGQYLIGIGARIEWGVPTLVRGELELIYERPSPDRLLILGKLRVNFPRPESDLIRLNIDVLGVVDFDRETFALDGTLYDSRILAFSVTGDMALRGGWGENPAFLLSVGGYNPHFTPPPDFPKLERITGLLTAADGAISIRYTTYTALTSNTFQHGERLEAHLGFLGFSIDGELGFDVLLQSASPELTADLHVMVALRFLGKTIAGAKLDGTLTGFRPLVLSGEVSFKVWIFSKSKSFCVTLIKEKVPTELPLVDPMPELLAALAEPHSWQAGLPAGHPALVSLRESRAESAVYVHPAGVITVSQQVLPLNLDLDHFGNASLTGRRRFSIERLTINGTNVATRNEQDYFARGQFLTLSDSEKLSVPSFERMDAGLRLVDGGLAYGGQTAAQQDQMAVVELSYETCILKEGGGCVVEPKPYRPAADLLVQLAETAPAVRSELERSGRNRYRAPGRPVQVQAEGFRVAAKADLQATQIAGLDGPLSYTQAKQALAQHQAEHPQATGELQVVPAFLTGEVVP
jgi:hypothetical protein